MDFLEKSLPLWQQVSGQMHGSEGRHIPVPAQDAGGCDAVGGVIPLYMSLEVMPPLELAVAAKKSE